MGWLDDNAPNAAANGDWLDKNAPKKEDAQSVRNAMGVRALSASPMLGSMAPDIAMGAKQVWDAGAQMLGRLVTGGPTSADTVANESKAAYEKNLRPDLQPGADIARSVGQAAITAPLMPAMAATTLPA